MYVLLSGFQSGAEIPCPSHTLQLAPLIGERASYHVLVTPPTCAWATDRPDVRADGRGLVNLILLVQDGIILDVSYESFLMR